MVAECRYKGDVPNKHATECMSLFYFRKYLSTCRILLALRNSINTIWKLQLDVLFLLLLHGIQYTIYLVYRVLHCTQYILSACSIGLKAHKIIFFCLTFALWTLLLSQKKNWWLVTWQNYWCYINTHETVFLFSLSLSVCSSHLVLHLQ